MGFKYGQVTAPAAGMVECDFSGAATEYRGRFSAIYIYEGGDVRFQDELGNIHFIEGVADHTIFPVRVQCVFKDDGVTPTAGEETTAVVYALIP